MKIDLSTLAFGYTIVSGGGTPNWATPLGQKKEQGYPINGTKPGIDELLRGIIRCHVPTELIDFVGGKGGNGTASLVIAASFENVFVETGAQGRQRIDGERLNLLVIEDHSESHDGRLQLKYPKSCVYKEGDKSWCNEALYKAIARKLDIENGCWFVSDISIPNQRDAILRVHIVDKDKKRKYADAKVQGAEWKRLVESESAKDENKECKPGENILLYGIPGCGKSHMIKQEYCDEPYFMERVLFHPDYTYSDFVGQVLPVCNDGEVRYEFSPGPFTRILGKAEYDCGRNYYLVIEELNRGNAPAIFGDLFQLLDRVNVQDVESNPRRTIGESSYFINNKDIAEEVYGYAEHPVRLPHNLFIVASMNTSDQNVFTLDTAFKRRWRMMNVRSDMSGCPFADTKICGTNVTWKMFVEKINGCIAELASEDLACEDKRLGAFFVQKEDLEEEATEGAKKGFRFAEKVLMYLWTDVFKNNTAYVFKPENKTLEELIDAFVEKKFKVFKEGLFPADDE